MCFVDFYKFVYHLRMAWNLICFVKLTNNVGKLVKAKIVLQIVSAAKSRRRTFPIPSLAVLTIIISAWESIERYTNTHIRCSLALHLCLSSDFMDLCMTLSCIFRCVSLATKSLYLLIFRKYLRYMAAA